MITVLVEQLPAVDSGATVEIEGDAYRHLCRARRVEVGDRVRVTDGRGRALWATIRSIDRRQAVLACGAAAPGHEPEREVELWVAAPRSSRASWLVEKATELGVRAIRFFVSERAVRAYGAAGLARLERVAGAAVAQCHRAWRPEITGMHDWSEVTALAPGVFLDPAGRPARTVTPFTAAVDPIVIIVGPEGGWTAGERDELAAAGHLATAVGARILRVETAALVGVALALAASDDPSKC